MQTRINTIPGLIDVMKSALIDDSSAVGGVVELKLLQKGYNLTEFQNSILESKRVSTNPDNHERVLEVVNQS